MDLSEDYSELVEGDLVFFPGHVGMYLKNGGFLHANAFDMQVSWHWFSDVLKRAKVINADVSAIRRLSSPT